MTQQDRINAAKVAAVESWIRDMRNAMDTCMELNANECANIRIYCNDIEASMRAAGSKVLQTPMHAS